MTAWREVNNTKAAGLGQWMGPHHPCKLQIRCRHMWLKTNIKIDMSCSFKQADTMEPHRRKAQGPGHYRSPRISRLGDAPQERGLMLRHTEPQAPVLCSLQGCLNMGGVETTWPEQTTHLPPPRLWLRAEGNSSDISQKSALGISSLLQPIWIIQTLNAVFSE